MATATDHARPAASEKMPECAVPHPRRSRRQSRAPRPGIPPSPLIGPGCGPCLPAPCRAPWARWRRRRRAVPAGAACGGGGVCRGCALGKCPRKKSPAPKPCRPCWRHQRPKSPPASTPPSQRREYCGHPRG